MFTLSENIFTLNFCRVVFENFDLQIWSKYGSGTKTNSMEEQYNLHLWDQHFTTQKIILFCFYKICVQKLVKILNEPEHFVTSKLLKAIRCGSNFKFNTTKARTNAYAQTLQLSLEVYQGSTWWNRCCLPPIANNRSKTHTLH